MLNSGCSVICDWKCHEFVIQYRYGFERRKKKNVGPPECLVLECNVKCNIDDDDDERVQIPDSVIIAVGTRNVVYVRNGN